MVIGNLFQYQPLATVHPKQLSVNKADEKKKLPRAPLSPPLFDYSKFNRRALVESVKNRHLVTSKLALQEADRAAKRKPGRDELRRKLEVADKTQDFKNYFEELPAEIRVRIYKYAMPKSYEPRPRPRLHALCQVSQLVRRETLSVYFERRPVSLYINATSKKWDQTILAAQYDYDTRFNLQQYNSLGWTPYMRNLYIKAYGNWFDNTTGKMNFFATKFEIMLNGEMAAPTVLSANTQGKPPYDLDEVDRRLTRSVGRGAQVLQSTQASGQRHMTRRMLEQYILQAVVRYC